MIAATFRLREFSKPNIPFRTSRSHLPRMAQANPPVADCGY